MGGAFWNCLLKLYFNFFIKFFIAYVNLSEARRGAAIKACDETDDRCGFDFHLG